VEGVDAQARVTSRWTEELVAFSPAVLGLEWPLFALFSPPNRAPKSAICR
jgi:hypothetical protein